MNIPTDYLTRLIDSGLREDLPFGDVTTDLLLGKTDHQSTAQAVVKERSTVVAGIMIAEAVFRRLDSNVDIETLVEDGEQVQPGGLLFRVTGSAQALLAGERLALNLLQRLSGIATSTRALVESVRGTGVAILDTRKTTPGLRILEKYAVVAGGGRNHRFSLSDGILLKENHIKAAGGIEAALSSLRLRETGHLLKIEVEVTTLDEASRAVEAGADMLLLDNFTVDGVRDAVDLFSGKIPLEVSGGIDLETVRSYAEAGPDFISVGGITHSPSAADISLLFLDTESK